MYNVNMYTLILRVRKCCMILQVYMIDYGFSEVLSKSNLRGLKKDFRLHQSYAFPSKLYGVRPAGGMAEWSRTACEAMEDLVCNRRLFLSKKVGGRECGILSCYGSVKIYSFVDHLMLLKRFLI